MRYDHKKKRVLYHFCDIRLIMWKPEEGIFDSENYVHNSISRVICEYKMVSKVLWLKSDLCMSKNCAGSVYHCTCQERETFLPCLEKKVNKL